uniref:Putative secreted protein n=1 Tax=Anopheles darlingi TaxID=43151 RepID=A0A2M4DBR0_ANODA
MLTVGSIILPLVVVVVVMFHWSRSTIWLRRALINARRSHPERSCHRTPHQEDLSKRLRLRCRCIISNSSSSSNHKVARMV